MRVNTPVVYARLLGMLILLVGQLTSTSVVAQERSFIDRLAPAECLMYSSWSGVGQKVEDPNNHAELLMAEPEVQEFFESVSKQVSSLAAMAMRNESSIKQNAVKMLAPELMTTLFAKPGAIFVESVEMGPNGPIVSAGAAFDVGDNAEDLRAALAALLQFDGITLRAGKLDGEQAYAVMVPDAPMPVTVFFTAANGKLLIGTGKEATERLVKVAKGGDPTGGAPVWLADVKKQLPIERRRSIGYINIAKAYQVALGFAGDNSRQLEATASGLGLSNLTTLVASAGYEGEGIVDHLRLNWSGKPTGILAMMGSKPINQKALSYLPNDTLFATSISLDLAEVMDRTLELMRNMQFGDVDDIMRDLSRMEEEIGINVKRDLLEPLGSTWTLFNASGDGLGSGIVLTVEVDDEDALHELFSKVGRLWEEVRDPNGPRIVQRELAGTAVYNFKLLNSPMPVQPSFAIHDGFLFVTLYPQILRPYLDPSDLDQKLEISELVKGENVVGYTYVDSRRQYELLYTYAAVFSGMGSLLAEQSGMGRDAEVLAAAADEINLPSLRCLYRHVIPSESVLIADGNGWQATKYQTVPSVNLAVAAPVGIGLLLPAVQAAREAARRTQSANNLKQLALACLNYESAYKRFPAGYSTDKDGRPLLSWRVHILPFMEQVELYQRFKLDEPWDSEHNIALLEEMPDIYRSPQSYTGPGNTVYLGIAGKSGVFSNDGLKPGRPTGMRFGDITDGASATILMIEASDELAVPWTKPNSNFNPDGEIGTRPLFGLHQGGTNAVFCDGSVQFLSEFIDVKLLKAMFTRNGGEVTRLP